ncbi:unnamed protein product [Dovyalis caffra]|uniref:alcohol dehydrogenase n=1 Tax=Dovyalis caffra TaxID=77055 RepID=A0AAV1SA02_9ROSI|nr:unnamed protein product [Dovyalis caffra]
MKTAKATNSEKAKDMVTAVNSNIQKAAVTLAIETAAVVLPFPLIERDLLLAAVVVRQIAVVELIDCSIEVKPEGPAARIQRTACWNQRPRSCSADNACKQKPAILPPREPPEMAEVDAVAAAPADFDFAAVVMMLVIVVAVMVADLADQRGLFWWWWKQLARVASPGVLLRYSQSLSSKALTRRQQQKHFFYASEANQIHDGKLCFAITLIDRSFKFIAYTCNIAPVPNTILVYTILAFLVLFARTAAICRIPGDPLVIEDIEVEPPKAWEVRIRILCASLCHSDVTFWKMQAGPVSIFPRIFGHEAAGVVESVGEHVQEVKEGDLVLPVFASHCGECRDCKSAKSNICSKFDASSAYFGMPRDGTRRFRDMKGEVLHHFLNVSSFSQYTVVDVAHVVKITTDIPIDKACLLSCGVSTGVGAAWKVAELEEGSTVAIFGLGAVGLAVAEGARIRGASKIIVVDLNPEKFEIGKKFGLTDFINPANCGEKPVSEVIKEITDGGADYCFECIGLASLMTDAFTSSGEGWGKTVVLGVEMHGSPLILSPYEILRGRTVTGSSMGGLKPKFDLPILAEKYLSKELNLEQFITHEVSFNDINNAFQLLLEGKSPGPFLNPSLRSKKKIIEPSQPAASKSSLELPQNGNPGLHCVGSHYITQLPPTFTGTVTQ